MDVYFSADIETDGPIPGPFSLLSFALVEAGRFDGHRFERPARPATFYRELVPISDRFQPEALAVNGLDRNRLVREGASPGDAMNAANEWIRSVVGSVGEPVLVAYPLSFDWPWLYWYFVQFAAAGSPFNHSRCFDIKTAYAVKARVPIVDASRSKLLPALHAPGAHTHHALDDAKEQAEIFARVMEWDGFDG